MAAAANAYEGTRTTLARPCATSVSTVGFRRSMRRTSTRGSYVRGIGDLGGNGSTRSNGGAGPTGGSAMPMRPGHRPGRWIERRRNSQAFRDRFRACDCDGALSTPREARHRHGASVSPLLRVDPVPPRSPMPRIYEPRVLVRRIERRKPTVLTLVAHGLASVVLVPSYALAAAAIGTPGMRFHLDAVDTALRLAAHGGTGLIAQAGRLALYPMDSTRYFEFDWVWSRLKRLRGVRAYLDVSSPRFLPLTYVRRSGVRHAWFVNPDKEDLATTERWAAPLSLSNRCRFSPEPIESVVSADERFDAITSISVF